MNVACYNDKGVLVNRNSQMQVAASLETGDRIEFDVRNITERLPGPFGLGPMMVPIGVRME